MKEVIQMVDLQSQYLKIKDEIDASINEVIMSSAFIKGQKVRDFEDYLGDFLGSKHVISCGNGTDAIQISLMALDLKIGDEVIIPAFTYVATAEVIALLGLVPVLVDVDSKTFNIDVAQIEEKISSKTRAIIPVHLFGQSCNMEPIMNLASKFGLYVIEDNAQAIGSTYTFSNGLKKSAGTIGHIGTTSFFPSKNLGCFGDGGAIFTQNDLLAERIRMICNHGQKRQYYHEVIGVNSRLDTIQAAILQVKLKHLKTYINARQEAAKTYLKLLQDVPSIIPPITSNYSTHVFHQYTLKLTGNLESNRDHLRADLLSMGIPTMIYYPLPIHLQVAFKQLIKENRNLDIAESLCKTVISLPMHSELNISQQEFIVEQLKKLVDKYSKIKNY